MLIRAKEGKWQHGELALAWEQAVGCNKKDSPPASKFHDRAQLVCGENMDSGFWILMTWTWILHLPWLSLSLWASHCTPLSFHFLQHKTKIIIQQIEFWRLSETMHVVFSSLALGNTQKVQLLWVNLGNIVDWWRSYFQSFGNHASERIWRIRSVRGGEKGDKIQLKPAQNELCSLVVL